MIKKIFISDNKEIGLKCKQWAKNNLPDGFEITHIIEECDIFISILYDKILSKDFIQTRECYNFHPAKLPEYAGVGGCTWSILFGESHHYITLLTMDEGIDTGSIIDKCKFEIENTDTASTLFKRMEDHMYLFFQQWFEKLCKDDINPTPQDLTQRQLFTKQSLRELLDQTRLVRATHFPGKPGLYYHDASGTEKRIEVSYDNK